jgi:hypothetical protein
MNDLDDVLSPVRGADRYRPLRRRAGRRAALRPGRDRGARSGVRQPSRAPMVNTQSTASGCSATQWTRLTIVSPREMLESLHEARDVDPVQIQAAQSII